MPSRRRPPQRHLATAAIHGAARMHRIEGSLVTPIFQSATYEYDDADYENHRYVRESNTPSHDVLGARLAAMDGAESAVVTGSGMAAIATTLLTVLRNGDHVVAQDCVYGNTQRLLAVDLPRYGIEVTFFDATKVQALRKALRSNTRALFVESLSNPHLRLADLEGIPPALKGRGIVSIVDNTFLTPALLKPLKFGFDLAIQSGTKMLNGHADVAAGVVAGSSELIARIKGKLVRLGGILDPHACFLLERGIKTLPLRAERHSRSALAIARFLEGHRRIAWVRYPGLASHPDAARAKAWLGAGCGGMLAFSLRGVRAAEAMVRRVRLATLAVSLGGAETLVVRPSSSTHARLTEAERRALGIGPAMVRMSVGLEQVDDLLADLDEALA